MGNATSSELREKANSDEQLWLYHQIYHFLPLNSNVVHMPKTKDSLVIYLSQEGIRVINVDTIDDIKSHLKNPDKDTIDAVVSVGNFTYDESLKNVIAAHSILKSKGMFLFSPSNDSGYFDLADKKYVEYSIDNLDRLVKGHFDIVDRVFLSASMTYIPHTDALSKRALYCCQKRD